MAKTLPPMLEVMKEIGGVEFPEILAKLDAQNATDVESKPADASDETPEAPDSSDKDV